MTGSASLTIESASVIISSNRFQVFSFDNSSILVENSTAFNDQSDQRPGAIFIANGNSTFLSNNSKLDMIGEPISFSSTSKSTITLNNSSVKAISLYVPLDSSVIFNNLKTVGFIDSLQILKKDTNLPYDLKIFGSTIEQSLDIWVSDSAQVTLNDCDFFSIRTDRQSKLICNRTNITRLYISFNDPELAIDLAGLNPVIHSSFELNLLAAKSMFIKLTDSTVGGWGVKIVSCPNSEFIIRDSHLYEFRPMNGTFNVTRCRGDVVSLLT